MISPLAYVDPSAKLGKNVTVHPFAYIDKNVEIGDDNVIMPYASLLWQQFPRILPLQVKKHWLLSAIIM